MVKRAKIAKLGIVILSIGICAELCSKIAVNLFKLAPNQDYSLFYTELSSNKPSDSELAVEWKSGFRRYPLFSHVAAFGNNFGFDDPHDFPRHKGADEFVIGVLGGSVANHFAKYIQKNPKFVDLLKRGQAELRAKKIVLLNLAVAGFKQPQQFVAFSYFLESLDAIIQIDGWNEAWISGSKAYPVDFPAFTELFYAEDDRAAKTLAHLEKLRERIQATAGFLASHPVLARSASMYLVLWAAHKYLQYRGHNISRFARNYEVKAEFYKAGLTAKEEADLRVKSWRKYLRLEAMLARAQGVKAFFFLQPSQYVEGSKIFTENEKAKAFSDWSRKKSKIFQQIRDEAVQLKNTLPIYDLNGLFANVNEEIYIDDCCHVNPRGNELMARAISEVLTRDWLRE